MPFQARAQVLAPSGSKITYGSGPNTTRAAALLELTDTLATVVGTVLSVSVTEELDADDINTFSTNADNDTPFEDAVLTLIKAGPIVGQILRRTKKIENMALAFKVASIASNLVETANPLVAAIVASYRDGRGEGGYSIQVGESYFKS